MLTKKDKSYLQKNFTTKMEFKELKNEVSELCLDFNDLKDELKKYKHETLSGLDQVMFELRAIREELPLIVYRQSEHSDQLENHEERIVKTEAALSLAC